MLTGSVQDCGPIRFCRVDWNPLQVGFGFSTDHCDQCSRLIENPRYSFVFKAPHQWFICRSWMSAGVYSMYQFGSFWGEKQQFVVARLPTSATGPPDNIPPPPPPILYTVYTCMKISIWPLTQQRERKGVIGLKTTAVHYHMVIKHIQNSIFQIHQIEIRNPCKNFTQFQPPLDPQSSVIFSIFRVSLKFMFS